MIPGLERLSKEGKIHVVVAEDFVDTATGTGLVHLAPGERGGGLPRRDEEEGARLRPDRRQGLVHRGRRAGSQGCSSGTRTRSSPSSSGRPETWSATAGSSTSTPRAGGRGTGSSGSRGGNTSTGSTGSRRTSSPPRRRSSTTSTSLATGSSSSSGSRRPGASRGRGSGGLRSRSGSAPRARRRSPPSRGRASSRQAVALPDGEDFELHRPWIDRIVLECPKCGSEAHREPFVLDTWHNSGSAPARIFHRRGEERARPRRAPDRGDRPDHGAGPTPSSCSTSSTEEARRPVPGLPLPGSRA